MNSVSPLGSQQGQGIKVTWHGPFLILGKMGKTMVFVLIIDRPKFGQRAQAVYMLQRDAIDHNNKLPLAEHTDCVLYARHAAEYFTGFILFNHR